MSRAVRVCARWWWGSKGAQRRERRSDRGGGRRGSWGAGSSGLAAEGECEPARAMLSATAGGSGLPPRLLSPAAGRPRRCRRRKTDAPEALAWLGPTEPAAQHSGGGASPALDPRWGPAGGLFVQRTGGSRPLRARSGPPDPVAAVPAVRSVLFPPGPAAPLGSARAWQAAPGGEGRWTRRGGRGGGFSEAGRPASPARGRGCAPSAAAAPLLLPPPPPSLDLKLQFALQLAENVGGWVKGDRGSGEQGWI